MITNSREAVELLQIASRHPEFCDTDPLKTYYVTVMDGHYDFSWDPANAPLSHQQRSDILAQWYFTKAYDAVLEKYDASIHGGDLIDCLDAKSKAFKHSNLFVGFLLILLYISLASGSIDERTEIEEIYLRHPSTLQDLFFSMLIECELSSKCWI